MKFLLIGPPASGKGTVGGLMSERLGIPLVSVGRLLRAVPEDSQNYKKINEFMGKGLLVPANIVAEILREELSKQEYYGGFILDGWMRDLEQKQHFDPEVDYVIFINVSDETALKRAEGRTEKREDDDAEVVKRRLGLFHSDTLPVIESYRESGKLIEINGEPSRQEVLDEVLQKLGEKGIL